MCSVLLLLAVFAAACGQKEGVHLAGAPGGGNAPVGADGVALSPSEGTVAVDTDGDGTLDSYVPTGDTQPGGQDPGTGTGTDPNTGGNTGGNTGTPNDPANDPANDPSNDDNDNDGDTPNPDDDDDDDDTNIPDEEGDSTGITKDTITIGVHAPLTGAAPIPQRSFEAGKDQYWKEVGKVYGREVKVIFKDDKYNPSAASQACQELIVREKVFILAGSGGTDQIAECARIAAEYGVPYLSAGVTRVRLDQLPNYFAQSKSYSDQMPLLMQWVAKNKPPANKRIGIIASNTANFDDAVAAFEEQARRFGYEPYTYRPSKVPTDSELAGYASRMESDDITVATPVMQPTAWIKLAKNAQLNGVQWAGIGVTMGLNSVATVVCPQANGAMFFSPFPGYNLHLQLDPRSKDAEDDIQWAQWGSNKSLHEIFKRMNGVLTRQAFAEAMIGPINTGIFPPTNHTETDHFRVDSVHVLHLDCSRGKGEFISNNNDLFRKSF
jgi:ABC-type branched-subunit amino acid transport system substrate-binding protein